MCRMRSHLVVVTLPGSQHGTCLPQRGEQGLVQTLVAQSANEALGERVLLRLAWRDIVPVDLGLLAPGQDGIACQLGAPGSSPGQAIVADAQQRTCATAGDDRCQLASNALARQRRISNQAQTFAREV